MGLPRDIHTQFIKACEGLQDRQHYLDQDGRLVAPSIYLGAVSNGGVEAVLKPFGLFYLGRTSHEAWPLPSVW